MPKRSKDKKRGNKLRIRSESGPSKAELKKLWKQHGGNTNRVANELELSWQQTDKLLREHGLKEDKVKNPPKREENNDNAPMGKREVARAVRDALGVKTFPKAVQMMEDVGLLGE